MSVQENFFSLTADRVIDAVEKSLVSEKKGSRATGRVFTLNSLENRVYEIEFEDRSSVVAKFYRPGRWSKEQILEEHLFLEKLKGAEIPVVSPLKLDHSRLSQIVSASQTLAENTDQILFAVFPKVRGRLRDELSDLHLRTLGRYVGRLHNVGSSWLAKKRQKLDAKTFGRIPLDYILKSPFLEGNFRSHYQTQAERVIHIAEKRLAGVPLLTLHGDCHLGNTLWSEDAPFFLDFDDMVLGPAVQDIWMIVRGRDEQAQKERQILIEAYEIFRPFDYESLSLIEPLRGLRMIHYVAWIARRWGDPTFPKTFPHFGSAEFWREEVEALSEIANLTETGFNY